MAMRQMQRDAPFGFPCGPYCTTPQKAQTWPAFGQRPGRATATLPCMPRKETMKSRVGERCRRIRSHLGSKSKDEQQVIQSHFATLVRRRATAPTGVERRTLRYFRVVPRRRRGRRELRCLACDKRATSPARSFHAVYQRHLEEIGYRPISFAGYMACINGEQHRASRVSRSTRGVPGSCGSEYHPRHSTARGAPTQAIKQSAHRHPRCRRKTATRKSFI